MPASRRASRVSAAVLLLVGFLLVLTGTGATAASAATAPERVPIPSGGETMIGYHYVGRPGAGHRPVVVMGIGFGSIQAMGLDRFAARYAAAGYDVLTFDYRYWGESSGTPRQLLDIPSQLDDWRAAIRAARSLPGVDPGRVALWGTSFAGGHVLDVAPDDRRLRAVIAQVPHVNGPATLARLPLGSLPALTAKGVEDQARSAAGRSPLYVPIASGTGGPGALSQAGALAGYLRLVPPGAPWRNAVPARVALQLPFYSPDLTAARSTVPTFMTVATRDNVVAPDATLRLARTMKATVRTYPVGHFDVYHPPYFDRVVDDQLAFLRTALPPAR